MLLAISCGRRHAIIIFDMIERFLCGVKVVVKVSLFGSAGLIGESYTTGQTLLDLQCII